MMRTTLYQLIQYVRDGETDPGLKAALRADPNSNRRLRQARFICKMIGRQDKPEPAPDVTSEIFARESFAASDERFDIQRQVAMESADFDATVSELRAPYIPEDEERIPEIRSMVLGSVVPGRDLGLLTASEQDGFIELSLQSDQVYTEMASGEIRIDVDGYAISITTRFEATEPLRLQFRQPPQDFPLKGLGVLFMPISGPFVRRGTDGDGVFELQPGFISGMLRISGRDFAFLRIARDK